PHEGTIASLEKDGIQVMDHTILESLEKRVTHHAFMEELLGKKDSPIRRRIIAQWLPRLNEQLAYYLSQLDLPHTVMFEDDLTPSIHLLGTETDFGSLSGGETERSVLALNWSFRDIFEHINFPINLIGIDERLDSGLDNWGVECAMRALRL